MDGGAIIGQGSYGCVFDPPLLCEEAVEAKKAGRMVGKLARKSDAKYELITASVLSEIPKYKEYFVLPNLESYCDDVIPLDDQPDKMGLAMCQPIERYGSKDMVHYTMPFGGVSIMKFFETGKKLFPVRDMIIHALEGAALMTLNGYVHYDIHMGNILIEGSKPRFIDFGFSFSSYNITQATLDERWKLYNPAYAAEPPEITIITGLKNWYTLEGTVKQVVKEKPLLKSAENMLNLSRFTQLNEFMKFWRTSAVCKKKDWLGFFRLYWPAFDAWGMGYIIIFIYSKALYVKNDIPDWRELSGQIKEILRGLLRMDPRRRLDCVEALHLFSPSSYVVSSASGKAWLEQRRAVRGLL
jgi:hypothetical protein